MPYSFLSRSRNVKCAGGCGNAIEAGVPHLVTAKGNFHLSCAGYREKMIAYNTICPKSVENFPVRVRGSMMAVLQKGKALHERKNEAANKLRAQGREIQVRRLHESCCHNDKCVIGYTSKCGDVITTTARFGYLTDATPGGRRIQIQCVDKEPGCQNK